MLRVPSLRLGILGILLAGACGCSTARIVSSGPNSAVVAIASNTNTWPDYNRKHAEELLREKFPQGYVIDKEEEFVVGTTQVTSTTTNRTGDPTLAALRIAPVVQTTDQTTTSRDQKEWRIYCHSATAQSVNALPTQPVSVVPRQSVNALPTQPVPVVQPVVGH